MISSIIGTPLFNRFVTTVGQTQRLVKTLLKFAFLDIFFINEPIEFSLIVIAFLCTRASFQYSIDCYSCRTRIHIFLENFHGITGQMWMSMCSSLHSCKFLDFLDTWFCETHGCGFFFIGFFFIFFDFYGTLSRPFASVRNSMFDFLNLPIYSLPLRYR